MDDTEVRRLAREVFAPLAAAGVPGRVNRPLVRALGDSGLLGRLFPTPLGGTGGDGVSATELCRLRETLARECTEAETALALQGLGTYPVVQSGSPELGRRVVPAVARGEAVAAFALSEPGAGTDAAALTLAAEPDGAGWRLSGEKTWISNAPDADVYTVFARTSPEGGARGVTAFVVDGGAAGLSGEPIEMLAPHAIGRLVFDGLAVGPDDVLGEVGGGFRVAMRTLDLFRPSVGAFAVGMAEAAIDRAVAHARERRAFGRTIGDFQAVSHTLADMATRTQAARLLVYEAARAYDEDRAPDVTRLAAMAKLYATETAQFVVDAAVQILGARALVAGHPLEHLYREVRAPRIYEGTSEIQRTIIARALLRPAPEGP
ncbi:MAG: acyl-CoA dehydrogenase [Actinomycetota bacterium]|jgi:alkylation response protein AidB-like acyl-CoA dehydrogenase|nr:acyl-CoA dehydrogenase [Actinomycetota bacterium]MDQ1505924.1 acyl-CoA dehydrogenase [Actinomycetota bacterium]